MTGSMPSSSTPVRHPNTVAVSRTAIATLHIAVSTAITATTTSSGWDPAAWCTAPKKSSLATKLTVPGPPASA